MWEAAGGIEAWRRFGSVGFTYQASLGPAALRAGAGRPEIVPAVASGDWPRLGPQRISFAIRDWSTMDLGGGTELSLGRPPRPDARDLALRGVRFLFCFPFMLGEPVWEFRRDLVPGFQPDPRGGFWAVPFAEGSPYECCYVDLPPGSGVPRAVYYRVSHPAFADRVFKAVFLRYETVQGIRIATEIAHYASVYAAGADARYPWERPGERAFADGGAVPQDGLVLLERFSEIELQPRAAGREPPAEQLSTAAGSAEPETSTSRAPGEAAEDRP
jgi:hypothetical protein